MNFFSAQDVARKHTARLVILFTIAVAGLIVLTNLLVAVVVIWLTAATGELTLGERLTVLSEDTWIVITLGVIAVVGLASLYKHLSLRGGGRTVAEALGGTPIPPNTRDLKQRRLLNVVEEMAIASGISVPPVYVMPDPGINAFAAGYTPEDAVIGVTQGTLDHLNREELQGVIGHEFSHVLNGDMRLNLRLIAILHGIMFLGLLGYYVLRGVRSRDAAPFIALGAGLVAIGFTGMFCGNLIKAGVSRQREFLADASAVQFTRNPHGIAGALKKIGGSSSRVANSHASEASHMFIAQAVSSYMAGLLRTHPPLAKRIRAIEPNWDGTYPASDVDTSAKSAPSAALGEVLSQLSANPSWVDSNAVRVDIDPERVVEQVGQPAEDQIGLARALIDSNDQTLLEAARDPWGARALIYAMLIEPEGETRQKQLDLIARNADRGVPQYLQHLLDPVAATDMQHRLALVELSMPALKELSNGQFRTFMTNLTELIKMDREIALFEWVLHRLLVRDLQGHFVGRSGGRATISDVSKVAAAAAELVSALALLAGDEEAQGSAFRAGMESLGIDGSRPAGEDPNFRRLNEALKVLRRLKPLAKPKLIKACAAAVTADGSVNADEAALLQGVAATLDCPLPPTLAIMSPAA